VEDGEHVGADLFESRAKQDLLQGADREAAQQGPTEGSKEIFDITPQL
jgi:hypothetical protein